MGKLDRVEKSSILKQHLSRNKVPFIYLGKEDILDDRFDVNSVIGDYLDLLKPGTKVSLIDYIKDKINRTVIDDKKLEYVSYRLEDTYPDSSSGLKYSKLTASTYETTLYITYRVHFNNSEGIDTYEEVEHPIFSLPIPTFRNTFVVNGTEFSLVSRMSRNSNIYTDVVYDRETSSMMGEPRFNLTVQLKGDLTLPTKHSQGVQDVVTFQLTFITSASGKSFIQVRIRSLNMIRHQNYGTDLDPQLSQYDIFKEYTGGYVKSISANKTIMDILSNIDWESNNLNVILSKVFGVNPGDSIEEIVEKVHSQVKQNYNNPASKSIYGREALYYKIIESPTQWLYKELTGIIEKSLFFHTFKGLSWNIFVGKSPRIRSLFLQNKLSQWLEDTNPVSEGSHKRRIAYDLDLPTNDDRIYHSSYRGTVCPIETPESGKIGIVLNYASGYRNTNKDTGYNIVALPPSLIPFLNKNDANRCLMGSNMLKQSLPLKKSKWSKVITENYINMYNYHWTNIKSPVAGVVTSVGTNRIRVKTGSGEEIPVEIYTNFSGNKKTNYTTVPKVKVGDRVEAGDILTESKFFKSGVYTPSTPLLAAYLPYNGYNFEDSIVISQRLVDEDILTSEWAETETLTFDKETLLPTQGFCDDYNISQDWVINSEVIKSKIGQTLHSGEPLFHYFRPVKLVDDFIVKTDNGYPQNLFSLVDIRAHYDDSRVDAIYLLQDNDILEITDENLNKCTSIVICTSGCHKVEEGDKLSGVHGNKGTVSKILPVDMMPRLPDGTPVDIVLNTMGIPSRMNVGQLFELSLGLCSETLRKRLEEYGDTDKGREYLRNLLVLLKEEIKPNHDLLDELIEDIDNGLVTKMVNTDVVFLMPQFQEITTSVVKLILRYLGLPEDSAARLYLPEFDETTKRKVIYGYNTILKLEHMVKKKTKARCNGLNNPDPTFEEHRGQRSGEMEFWALESHHATATINEMLKYTSGNYQNKKKLYMGLMTGRVEINPGTSKSPTLEKFSEYMRALGFDIVETDKNKPKENEDEIE